ncbi:MAG: hypothetical protein QXK55_07785 [Nitrososphaeria archaeon]
MIYAKNFIAFPGPIDLHIHVSYNVISLSVDLEQACLRKGVTTVVDAGSTGHLNSKPFKKVCYRKIKNMHISEPLIL